jgi:hypothetical protein
MGAGSGKAYQIRDICKMRLSTKFHLAVVVSFFSQAQVMLLGATGQVIIITSSAS